MLKKLLAGVLLVITGILIVAARKPDTTVVSASGLIHAPQEIIFKIVGDFHRWREWSPWAGQDPDMQESFEGRIAAEGSVYQWTGNREAGEGSHTITTSKPYESLNMQTTTVRPMSGSSGMSFTFAPEANGTLVTWTMTSEATFLSRLMSLFLNTESMTSDVLSEGLANLARIATAPAPVEIR